MKVILICYIFINFILTQCLNCDGNKEQCGEFCFNKQNEFCCDNRTVCKQDQRCCRWGGTSRLCYYEQTHQCCSLGRICKKDEPCCGIECCMDSYYCWQGLHCKLEFYLGFNLIFPGILSIISILSALFYFMSNRPKSISSADSLPTVSNKEILEGLHNQKEASNIKLENEDINRNLQIQIGKRSFNSRNEFEEFILGELNSFYWKSASIISFFSILPLYLCVIYRELAIIFVPVILTFIVCFAAQIIATFKIGKVSFDKYGYFILFFSVVVGCYCFTYGVVKLNTDSGRLFSRLLPIICYLPQISVISNSIKLATNEDKTILIGEALSKSFSSERIDYTTVRRTETTSTMKIIVAYPRNLIR